MTEEEDRDAQRLGYWLRRVRLQKGATLESAAMAAGLRPKSGSTVSLWERGQRPLKVHHLRRLARFYGVPESFFTHPQKTDDERLAEALADAEALERADWERERGEGPSGGNGRGGGPRRPH